MLKKILDWFKQDKPVLDYPSKEEYFSRRDKDVEFVLLQAREGLKKAMWAGESVFRVGDERPRKDKDNSFARIWNSDLRIEVAKILKQELKDKGFSVQPIGYNDYYAFINIDRD